MHLTPVGWLIFLNVRPKNIWFLRADEEGNLKIKLCIKIDGLDIGTNFRFTNVMEEVDTGHLESKD